MTTFTDHTDYHFSVLKNAIGTRCRRRELARFAENLGAALRVERNALNQASKINDDRIKAPNEIVIPEGALVH